MTKELQDLAWSILPKEFKEEVKKIFYMHENNEIKVYLIHLFGLHNLTSDAEGEDELLTVPRKEIVDRYTTYKTDINYTTDELKKMWFSGATSVLANLFGNKCLPDKPNLSEILTGSEPKPAEPNIDDILKSNADLDPETEKLIDEITTQAVEKFLQPIKKYFEKLDEKAAEPSSQVKEAAAYDSNGIDLFEQHFAGTSIAAHGKTDDHIADVSKMMRLNIAAVMAQGLLSNGNGFYIDDKSVDKTPENIAEAALLFADALINEAEKGGNNE